MSRRGSIFLLLLIGVVAATAVAVLYFGFVSKKDTNRDDGGGIACTQDAMQCPDGSAVGRTGPNCEFTQCPSANDVAGWQTYRNEKYGFEFKYPNDWSIRTDGINDFTLLRSGMSLPGKDNLPARDGIYWGDIVIDIHSNFENATVAEYLKQSGAWNPFTTTLQYKQFTINGGEVFKFSHTPGFFTSSFAYIKGQKLIIEIADIDVDDEFGDAVLDQILSTFTFINPIPAQNPPVPPASAGPVPTTKPIDTSGWVPYRNTNSGFGFRYPHDHTVFSEVNQETNTFVAADSRGTYAVIAEDESKVFSGSTLLATSGATPILSFEVANFDQPFDWWLDNNLERIIPKEKMVSKKNITFAGKPAVEVVGLGGAGSVYKLILVKPGNFFIIIMQSTPSKFLDAVLGTFSFNPSELQ